MIVEITVKAVMGFFVLVSSEAPFFSILRRFRGS